MQPSEEMPPLRIALTGGLAAGKSTVAEVFEEVGAATLDTDIVAHRRMAPGGPLFEKLIDAFGDDLLAPDGSLDRARLGERVFADPAALGRLNALVHPAVRTEVAEWLVAQREAGRHAVVTVPLLFEAGMADGWDAILCVTASGERVRQRLRARGLSEAQTEARLAAQWPVEEKIERADIVIENDGSRAELKRKVFDIWRELTQKEQAHHG